MKTLKFLALFTGMITLIMVAGCKKDEDTSDENKMPAYEAKTIEIPDAMAQSSNVGAQETKSYISMINGMASFGSMLTPPAKSTANKHLKDSGTETYSWEVNEGTSNYTVTLNVTETASVISWECILNGIMEGITFNNFTYIRAEEYKDGTGSRFTLYDWETSGINMDLSTQVQLNGITVFTLEMPEKMIVSLNIKADGSGTMEFKDWINGQYITTFESEWDATGHGEFWEYDDGNLIDHGVW